MAMSRSAGGTSLIGDPPIDRIPEVMSSSPAIILRAVVFPQPDGPRMTMNSPSRMSRESSSTAARLPKVFVTRSNATLLMGPFRSG